MRTVIQRVSFASVEVEGKIVGEIGNGLLLLLGVGAGDTERSAEALLNKVLNLRIFPDENGKMNRSILEVSGELLIVSQFTLYADVRKGRRPSFTDAANPENGKRLYEYFISQSQKSGLKIASGIFQADMNVSLLNSGPVTIYIDTADLITPIGFQS